MKLAIRTFLTVEWGAGDTPVVPCCKPAVASGATRSAQLTQTIKCIRLSVVATGTFLKTRSPSIQIVDTGFAVADGRHAIDQCLQFLRHYLSLAAGESGQTPIFLRAKNEAPVWLVSNDSQ